MNNSDSPRRVQQYLSVQPIGAETLVYDECRHKAFCLNESSSVIWRLADGEHTVAQIREAASIELHQPLTDEFVHFALEELQCDGLLEPPSAPATEPTISRRAMLQRLGVGGAMLLPAVAAIMAPTAAQAYSGCVDCTTSPLVQSRIRGQQPYTSPLDPLGGPAPYTPYPGPAPYSPYSGPRYSQAPPPAKPDE